jgi:hypothetical protein
LVEKYKIIAKENLDIDVSDNQVKKFIKNNLVDNNGDISIFINSTKSLIDLEEKLKKYDETILISMILE